MIKEYFTDGLIGLAILLSIFRTDLVGINNLINYPEVQEIILGQTVAYLPASYNHIINSHHPFESSKHLELSNEAFSAWHLNINNLPFLRERHRTEIEAFLVSGTQQNVELENFTGTPTTLNVEHEDNQIVDLSGQNLPEESASSYSEATISNDNVPESSEDTLQTAIADTSIVNNPFPGCNLTKEDLDLIDVLWQQDVDLGVGKEVFDLFLRQEIETKKEQELLKHQEWEKSQLQLREKQEKERQEEAEKWLKENFRRDGETGEWIRNSNGPSSSLDYFETDDSFTLEAALDYLSTNIDHALIKNLDISPGIIPSYSSDQLTDNCLIGTPEGQGFQQSQQLLSHQDSLEESLNGLLDFLSNEPVEDNSASLDQFGIDLNTGNITSDMKLDQDLDAQTDYLIQNVTMQSQEIQPVANEMNATFPFLSTNSSDQMNFDLDSLSFLNSLATMQNGGLDDGELFENIPVDSNETLLNANIPLNESMDTFTVLHDNFSQSLGAMASPSSYDGLCDSLDGLEGAIGGSDLSASSQNNITRPYSKVNRLSESSNDSGYPFQSGFSSSSPASSSASSPAGCHYSNISTSGNDTEQDPQNTQTVARHAVAHNHTYNTPPGQVPREVKKYAPKEPSRKGPHSRDQRRLEEFKIPYTIDDIIESPVETFNEMLKSHKLSEAQLSLIRDIRRRGKNKIAAQNCRKRKVNVIVNLSDEMVDLEKARDKLLKERAEIEKETLKMKEKFGHLYTHIFQSLRDEHGQPYDPNLYSLQQTSDGDVLLVPQSMNRNKYSNSSSASSSPTSSKDSVNSKKRKSFDE
ncbi:nuclear factor erythroid 2-related factor 2-like isoform X1 [Biomphalaria glabrata]|uniref:Nuclear factor erythroid 2-related factor 2-like isoform X1 n=1 Tax=Biomphalaria glabrata TaxID=6526 RepID=A0A9U8DZJ8_BIOGL|nr:nuclear factor erythroid 2-related factor 2-like isoform X1 [Biomphalaria glabrata]